MPGPTVVSPPSTPKHAVEFRTQVQLRMHNTGAMKEDEPIKIDLDTPEKQDTPIKVQGVLTSRMVHGKIEVVKVINGKAHVMNGKAESKIKALVQIEMKRSRGGLDISKACEEKCYKRGRFAS